MKMIDFVKRFSGIGIVAMPFLSAGADDAERFDGYYNYINDYPVEAQTYYAEDIQGIAHDDDHWFITMSGSDGNKLYKIHVSEPLSYPTPTAETTPLLSGLWQLGFTKFKAMDSYKNPYDGAWYLVVAVEGHGIGGVAIYDNNLTLKGAAAFSDQKSAGWCAVDNDGFVFSGISKKDFVKKYSLDWAAVAATGAVSVQFVNNVDLKKSDGSSLTLDNMQGADFTPEGDKLFMVTGFVGVPEGPDGIHVFDATDTSNELRRIRKSGQSGLFEYEFDTEEALHDQEPEGLIFWDLTDGRAPSVQGELHVLLLDNDLYNDDIYIKHYTKGIYVNSLMPDLPSSGDPNLPDSTITEAVGHAYNDMELRITGGNYPESVTISKRLLLKANPGTGHVVIGM